MFAGAQLLQTRLENSIFCSFCTSSVSAEWKRLQTRGEELLQSSVNHPDWIINELGNPCQPQSVSMETSKQLQQSEGSLLLDEQQR